MKISLALGPRKPLDRSTAWGCLTANLAVPGTGSLVAGRITGYFQFLLTLIGFALTLYFGSKFILWYLTKGSQGQPYPEDVGERFQELWIRMRWALLGMAVFLAAILWALSSSIGILLESKRAQSSTPPVVSQVKR